jgi:PAS domain S-box-containing protein
MKILIVDDKPENSYLLESLLKGNGYETVSANNGAEALKAAVKNDLALIISDILMPVMDGFTFCIECKKIESLKNIPFIFYTATYTSLKDEEFALSLGADKFILKPQDPDVFIELVKDVLNEVKTEKVQPTRLPTATEEVILKKYNSALIRKLEDKMAQTEEAEKELREINAELRKEIEDHILTEDALRVSEEKFKIIFEDASVGMCLTGLDGSFILVNKVLSVMLGYTTKELLNKKLVELTHKDDVESCIKSMQKMTSGEMRIHRFEERFIHKNGEIVFTDLNITLIKDSKGCPLFFVTHLINITDRVLAEKKITLLAHSIKSVSECITITDENDNIVFVNEAFIKTYGYTEFELIGKNISIIRPKGIEKSSQFKDILQGTISGGWKGEVINIKKDGTEFPVSLSTSVIKNDNDKPIALIGVATDITEARSAREELIRAKEQAEKSNKLKTEFLAQMSHEIRTPMNAIISFTDLLKDGYFENLTQELSEILNSITTSGKRIIRTVDLILNASEMQIGSYQPTFKKINLEKRVLDIIQTEFSALARQKELQLIFKNNITSPVITGDSYSINQIFTNLIDNAVKYTEAGSVSVLIDRDNEDNIFVSVSDTGIGISTEYFPLLFEPFMQEERGYSRRYEGNGLGLSLVKKYCELNGINVTVESKKSEGSRFTVTFTNGLNQ